jgi:predicted anti-sigma-YlaC factor YlaD
MLYSFWQCVAGAALVLGVIAAIVGAMVFANAIAGHLHPFTTVVIGGTLFVAVLLAFAWAEEGRRS